MGDGFTVVFVFCLALSLGFKCIHSPIEALFVFECPLYNSIRDRFPFLFESLFHSNYQIGINLYLMEAITLCYSKVLVSLS